MELGRAAYRADDPMYFLTKVEFSALFENERDALIFHRRLNDLIMIHTKEADDKDTSNA